MNKKILLEKMAEYHIPEHCRGSLERYFINKIPPGSFLEAVLANDLVESFGRADQINQHSLDTYAAFLQNYAPKYTWGSYETVSNWLEQR